MGNVTIETITYGRWGKAVRLTNGVVELVASLDFGPRIIRFGFVDGPNFFMEDAEEAIVQQGDHFAPVGGGAWKIYGGHRLWTSPEAVPRSTYPDNDPVEWKGIENGIVLTPPEERWTQLQKEIEVRMEPASGEVTVVHRVTNRGAWPVEFAPWALSVMGTGGTAVIPQAKRETGLLANRVLAVWPYSRMNDERVYWGERYIVLKQGSGPTPFKIGTNNEEGWAGYFNHNSLFLKKYKHEQEGCYPDYGVSFESYVCDHFLELESLGELRTVQPGQTAVHEEAWSLIADVAAPSPSDEKELDRLLEGYR